MTLTIGKRIGLLLTLVLAITAVVSVIGVTRTSTISASVNDLTRVHVPLTDAMHEIDVSATEQYLAAALAAATKDPAAAGRVARGGEQVDGHIKEARAAIEADGELLGRGFGTTLAEIDKSHDDFEAEAKRLCAAVAANADEKTVHEKLADLSRSYNACMGKIDRLLEENAGEISRVGDASNRAASTAVWVLVSLGTAGVLAGTILGWLLARGIVRSLRQVIDSLTEGAEQTASAAGQVSAASQSLAQGASEQAASIEETTSSVEEMASMTRQNAANAGEAKNLAETTRGSADQGTEAMERLVGAINDIQKSADDTSKIVKTIDEIAFQTNLLALNAAVEAARAGEAGKSFAVVAEEVRNLALRSAEAAKSTSALIEQSVNNANNGVQITTQVREVFREITGGSRKVNDLVDEIAAACNEQAQGIEQINIAVGQMDTVTQQNAANAEESASAAEELSAQAESLNQMILDLCVLVGGSRDRQPTARTARSHLLHHGHEAHPADGSAARAASAYHEPVRPATGNGHNGQRRSAKELIPLEDDKTLSRY